ncbi:Peptidase S8/S53 subtilisin/kexin/sedolisin [Penicillium cf. griseofulvum]|uniref:Peptidase S8/S53 subtilisin/kexin/sedolisin n=1 Tax=Penicillium cf. griseofulvum TaxID=2972120 RepID=A0A9W9M3G5_9EURO|nr:Peptidase S8/S53 subtilisin/kexin/sedolisin [Penicillium cf. griseofulvum]KAJ5436997.1 Peptidase S8/S53 subtilisin/kexin/sedolisin [Penicillium cf. griseofulvum]
MARMIKSDHGDTNVALLLRTTETIREILRDLRNDGAIRESRHFYSSIMAHCLVIRDHINRIKLIILDDSPLVASILARFEATVNARILEAQPEVSQTAYPRLWALNRTWERARYDSNTTERDLLLRVIDLTSDPDESDRLIEFLESWEDDINHQYPDDPASWPQDDIYVQKRRNGQPLYAAWNASQSLFRAFLELKDCGCQPMHDFGVRLCLGTFQYLSNGGGEEAAGPLCGFEMFLSMQKEWHEADVHFAKGAAVTFTENNVPGTRKPKAHAMKVKKLCEPIKKRKPFDRIKLKIDEDGLLWKLRSEKSFFTIDQTKAPVSLQQLIQDQYRSLTDKTKRILAVLLSYAVLYLHETPWLPPTWGPSSILFFHTTSAAIPLKPFIQTQLAQHVSSNRQASYPMDCDAGTLSPDDLDPDDLDPDDIDPDDIMLHQCPQLVTLGIMLMELYLATTFDNLAEKFNVPVSEHTSLDAELVFQQCKSEIPENSQFYYAVEKCLDSKVWEDDNGVKLDGQILRTTIYQQVVRPLEDELSQAFSYISIEDLDRIAQTLDLGSWGQVIQNQQRGSRHPDHPKEDVPKPPFAFTSHYDVKDAYPQQQQQQQQQQYFPLPPDLSKMILSPTPHMTTSPYKQYPGALEYKAMRFFDDETVSEKHFTEGGNNYYHWRQRFKDVYEKYTTQPPNDRVKIAILDTGIDYTHPDVDACVEQVKGEYNWTNEKFVKRVDDYNGHGTFIAGLLLEYAPDAELYISKVSDGRPCSPSIIAKAIDYAVKEWKVDFISMSFGFPSRDIDGYDELESAIQRAYAANVLLFAAASNSGANLDRAFPARDENVICIHSTDSNGNRSPFSPTALADTLNLATVGEDVESSWPKHLCEDSSGIKHRSGTSYATPIAVAIAAFILQYAQLYLPDKASMLKRQSKMKAVLRRISEKSLDSRVRDDYHFVALNGYSDNLFGKDQGFINHVLRDILSQ